MLDLANLVSADSEVFAVYRRTWEDQVGGHLDDSQTQLGYRWANLQIPVQYLPWTFDHRPSGAVDAALDEAERALHVLRDEVTARRFGLDWSSYLHFT